MTAAAGRPDDAEVGDLRTALATAEPGSEAEVDARLRLADRIGERFESADPSTRDGADLDEIIYHADWVLGIVEPFSTEWFHAQFHLLGACEERWDARSAAGDLDRAIAVAAELATATGSADEEITHARLLLLRHAEYDEIPFPVVAEEALLRAKDADPTRAQQAEANALLGKARAGRIRAGLGTTTTVLDLEEAIGPLQDSVRHLPDGTLLRDQVLFELGVIHALRYTDPAFRENGGDADNELLEAIECLRDVRTDAPDVGYELVQALLLRQDDHPDPEDREDAIQLLHLLADDMVVAGLGAEHAEMLGRLYLARHAEDESPETLELAVSFLERAVESSDPDNAALESMLLEFYGRRRHATPAERARERRVLARMVGSPAGPTAVGAWSVTAAVHALESGDPARLAAAIAALRTELCEGGDGHDDLVARTTLLGLLLVAHHTGDAPPENLRPMGLLAPWTRLAADMLSWLEGYRGRVPPDGDDDALYLLSMAALHAMILGEVTGTAVAGQLAQRRPLAADLAEVVSRFDGVAGHAGLVLVARLLLGAQRVALGQLLEDPDELREAAALFNTVLDGMGKQHPLLLEATVRFGGTAVVGYVFGVVDLPHDKAVGVLREQAENDGLPRDTRATFRYVLSLLSVMAWARGTEQPDLTGPVDECLRAIELMPHDNPELDQYRLVLATLLADRFGLTGDLSDLETARLHLDRVLSNPDVLPAYRTEARDMRVRLSVLGNLVREGSEIDDETLAEGISGLRAQIRALEPRPGAHRDGTALAIAHIELARLLLQRAYNGDHAVLDEAAVHAIAAERIVPASSPLRGRIEVFAAMVTGLLACIRRDRIRLLDSVRRAEAVRACDLPTPLGVDRDMRQLALATMWLQWSTIAGDPAALDQALAHHRLATTDDELSSWTASELHQLFATAAWNRGRGDDVDRSVELGMSVLRTLLWQVLLQSGPEYRLQHAERAADWASTVAMRCLVVGDRERAVAAIEAGRGLVLRAGAVGGRLAELLRRAGLPDLADEWDREGEQDLPGLGSRQPGGRREPPAPAAAGLRHQALQAIRRTSSAAELTGTPPVGAIADALRALDLDVLMYLVPGRDANFGRALLVYADGETDQILLPGLRADAAGPVARYVAARRAVDLDQRSAHTRRVWQGELAAMGAWAWRHAIGPLRTRLRDRALDRVPRVVLVPCGALGVVPWHAARERTFAGSRYALQDLVFSYAGSARQLVAVAARPRRSPAERPVVVADPTGTLVTAPYEARYLAGLYPASRIFGLLDGVPVAGRGSRDEVLGSLAGASMVHFGCHAEGGRTPSTSLLKLADRQTLTVDRLLRRAQRGGDATGATIVLAACQSDLSEDSHDEALTLVNAFVAAGATSVIGTRWAVHDLASSALMCVFHERLREPGARPLDALRAAQLWALDPDRRPPDGMADEVVRHLAKIDLRAPELWAGFVHCGW